MQTIDDILQQVAASGIGSCTDYSFHDRHGLDMGLAGAFASEMMPVAGNKAGCVVAIYKCNAGARPDAQPLVWLDSEGSPNGIFAKDLNAFLRLIPFGSGLVYDVLAQCLRSFEEKIPAAAQRFEALQARAQSCAQPECVVYRQWLSQQGLAEENNPVAAIREAFSIEPDFHEKLMQAFTQK